MYRTFFCGGNWLLILHTTQYFDIISLWLIWCAANNLLYSNCGYGASCHCYFLDFSVCCDKFDSWYLVSDYHLWLVLMNNLANGKYLKLRWNIDGEGPAVSVWFSYIASYARKRHCCLSFMHTSVIIVSAYFMMKWISPIHCWKSFSA